MFRHDLKHTGRTKYTGPPIPNLSWKYKLNDGIASSAAIHSDGTIYVGVGFDKFNLSDPNLYAFNPNGTLKWKFDGKHGFFSSPSIASDGTIYCVSNGDFLFSLKDSSTHADLNWKLRLEYFFGMCSPTIGNDGTIHVGSPSYYYFQINPDGTVKWRYKTEWCIISSPAIDDYGTVYIGSKDHNLYAFDESEQKLKWKYPTGKFYDGHLIDSSPAIGENGTIYFGTDPYGAFGQDPIQVETNFWAVNPNGTLKWIFETEDGVESSPATSEDGTIYFGSYDTYLYSIKDTSDKPILNWKYKTDGPIDGSPIIDGDGTIYFASRDSYLYALYPNGTLKWKFKADDGFESSPAIDSKGFLYIGSFDGYFYCIGTGKPDVGVEKIDIPSYISPRVIINPTVIIRNYRNTFQNFSIKCEIESNENIIYLDIKNINISGGISKELIFKPIKLSDELGVIYNVTATIQYNEDENPYNNVKTKKITTSKNFPPYKPTIYGPSIGKTGLEYSYVITTNDPNGDDVYYWISWHENYPVNSWEGPFKSGEEFKINYTYQNDGIYNLKIKSKDIHDGESEWANIRITMPKININSNMKIIFQYYKFIINKYL
jgi:outer membrane protein assembly factor BamB